MRKTLIIVALILLWPLAALAQPAQVVEKDVTIYGFNLHYLEAGAGSPGARGGADYSDRSGQNVPGGHAAGSYADRRGSGGYSTDYNDQI